jgi:uncharacterized protein (TIGR00369 family)
MNALVKKYIESNRFGVLLGMDLEIVSPGEVICRMTVEEKHLATPSAAHGGAIGALADAALGTAGLSAVCEENKVVSTVEYKINFLSPANIGDKLIARGSVLKKGNRLLVIECEIKVAGGGRVVALALGTFNSYDAAKAGY